MEVFLYRVGVAQFPLTIPGAVSNAESKWIQLSLRRCEAASLSPPSPARLHSAERNPFESESEAEFRVHWRALQSCPGEARKVSGLGVFVVWEVKCVFGFLEIIRGIVQLHS